MSFNLNQRGPQAVAFLANQMQGAKQPAGSKLGMLGRTKPEFIITKENSSIEGNIVCVTNTVIDQERRNLDNL